MHLEVELSSQRVYIVEVVELVIMSAVIEMYTMYIFSSFFYTFKPLLAGKHTMWFFTGCNKKRENSIKFQIISINSFADATHGSAPPKEYKNSCVNKTRKLNFECLFVELER